MLILDKEITERPTSWSMFRKINKVVCDDCKAELTDLYAEVNTYHKRWGNDSIDSYTRHQLCFDCALKFFKSYTENPQITDSFTYHVSSVGSLDTYMPVYESSGTPCPSESSQSGSLKDLSYKIEE